MIFQIQELSMYAREEKLAGAEGAANLEGWGYALPENFAIWRH